MTPSNYSFIDDHLAGSAQPYAVEDLERYQQDEVTHIISLTPQKPLVTEYTENELTHIHLPVYGGPDDVQIEQFLDIMSSVVETDQKAVVHCQFGQERTGIFLTLYLVELKNFAWQDAIAFIREKRPSSLRSTGSINFLRERYQI